MKIELLKIYRNYYNEICILYDWELNYVRYSSTYKEWQDLRTDKKDIKEYWHFTNEPVTPTLTPRQMHLLFKFILSDEWNA